MPSLLKWRGEIFLCGGCYFTLFFSIIFLLLSDAFDTEQLLCAMEKLRHGQAVDIPNYDFKSYKNVFPARRVQFSYAPLVLKNITLLDICQILLQISAI